MVDNKTCNDIGKKNKCQKKTIGKKDLKLGMCDPKEQCQTNNYCKTCHTCKPVIFSEDQIFLAYCRITNGSFNPFIKFMDVKKFQTE